MCPIDFGVQRSRSWCIGDWKWFQGHDWLCNPPMLKTHHTLNPHESRMWSIEFGSKGQGHWILVIENGLQIYNWLCNPPMIRTLHTIAFHESRMCPIDFGFQRSSLKVMGHRFIENGIRSITDSVIHLWSWYFLHLIPMSQGCTLLVLGSKGQGHGASVIENGFRTITDSTIPLWSWNLIQLLPMSQGCALLILGSHGQRSSLKVMGHRWLKTVSSQ